MSTPAEPPAEPPAKPLLPFKWWWPLLSGVLAGLAIRLVFSGLPGRAYAAMMASFILLVPVVTGAVTVYVAETIERRGWDYYFFAPFVANLLLVGGSLVILVEGLICAIVIVPLFAVVGGFAGLVMGAICRATRWPRQAVFGIAVLPLVLGGFEQHLPLPAEHRAIERSIFVAAAPERVWQALVDTRDIEPHEVGAAWMYRIGVPLPRQGVTEATPQGMVRTVTRGKGIRFEQVAAVWEPGRHVRWSYLFADDSFPPGALDDHVKIGGHYFDLGDTDYLLVPRDGGTELRVTMRFRVSTAFNWYAVPVAELLVGNFEDVILAFYGRRAEGVRSGG